MALFYIKRPGKSGHLDNLATFCWSQKVSMIHRFHCTYAYRFILIHAFIEAATYVTGSGKTGLIVTITDIHFLPVRESCTHALPRNTKYLIIDGQVCFYRRLFTDAVKPPGCISWPWRALMGLHGVPGCSSRQSWPPLWILPVCVPCWGHNTAA